MSHILEKPVELLENSKLADAGIERAIYKNRLHNLNLLKDLISTSNEVFKYLGEPDRIIEPNEFERLSGEEIGRLIKNIIRETKTVVI